MQMFGTSDTMQIFDTQVTLKSHYTQVFNTSDNVHMQLIEASNTARMQVVNTLCTCKDLCK